MLISPTSERDALVASFGEVAEQSFFAFAEVGEPSAAELAVVPEWLSASVAFQGAARGRVRVTLPADLAAALGAAFLGAGPEDELPAAAIDDLAGELANMTCGAWLTALRRSDAFTLAPPEVARQSAPAAGQTLWMICNGQPVGLTVAGEDAA